MDNISKSEQKRLIKESRLSKSQLKDNFVNKMNALIADRGYTQDVLASKLGIEQAQLNRYLNTITQGQGKNRGNVKRNDTLPEYPIMCQIADLFGVTIDQLLGVDGDSKKHTRQKTLADVFQEIIQLCESETAGGYTCDNRVIYNHRTEEIAGEVIEVDEPAEYGGSIIKSLKKYYSDSVVLICDELRRNDYSRLDYPNEDAFLEALQSRDANFTLCAMAERQAVLAVFLEEMEEVLQARNKSLAGLSFDVYELWKEETLRSAANYTDECKIINEGSERSKVVEKSLQRISANHYLWSFPYRDLDPEEQAAYERYNNGMQ